MQAALKEYAETLPRDLAIDRTQSTSETCAPRELIGNSLNASLDELEAQLGGLRIGSDGKTTKASMVQGSSSEMQDAPSDACGMCLASSEDPTDAATQVATIDPSTTSNSAAFHVPKLSLNHSTPALPSPFSPSDTLRPLTPPFPPEPEPPQTKALFSLEPATGDDRISVSPLEASQETISATAHNDVSISTLEGRKHQEPTMNMVSCEAGETKLDLGLSVATDPSPPTTPSEIPHPLTPSFPDQPDWSLEKELTLPPGTTSRDAGRLIVSHIMSDRRRHSSAGLSPTTETDDLLPPVPFPEHRRYSLVDSGPVYGPGAGRRTISDVGLNAAFLSPQRRPRMQHADTDSPPSSRSASRPSTARFSTFAEMGIQSVAMAKGEKTVDATKKDKKGNTKDGKKKRRSDESTATEPNKSREERSREFGSDPHSQEIGTAGLVGNTHKSEDNGVHDEMKKVGTRRKAKGKGSDCIIM